jgi:cytidine deaminase
MFFAHAAALRSGSLSRQVGAAICTTEGDIVAVGTNEVPSAGGGSYWEGDDDDQRDHVTGADPGDQKKRVVTAEVLGRLNAAGWLSEGYRTKSAEELAILALDTGGAPLRNTQMMRVVEYVRAVHAEMAAITDAARRGTSVRGCTLFTTTFPCHHCARHIIAAGIRRVVYVEPYPKSLATDLHRDAIEMEPEGEPIGKVAFEPFVGVAPRQYSLLFAMGRRKDEKGNTIRWHGTSSIPRHSNEFASYRQAETVRLKELGDRLAENELSSVKEESGD